ncbi:5883_t:CDS:2, partial [Entrophospora sp. SA101]
EGNQNVLDEVQQLKAQLNIKEKEFKMLKDKHKNEVKLHFINENINIEELGIDSEEAFQKYLKSCIISNCLNIKIQVSTQQRPFTEWNLKSLKLAKLVIAGNNEATKDKFVLPFLVIAASTFRGRIKIYPQYDVSGTYGCGPLDFCIHLDEDIICVVEVKKSDIDQGVAQCMMQLHAFFEVSTKTYPTSILSLHGFNILILQTNRKRRQPDLFTTKLYVW